MISTANGRIGVIQIAGLVARRIVSFVREGQTIGAGERFGLIRFGSRLDVYLPEGTSPLVAEGQTAIAGETILADFRLGDAGRTLPRRLTNAWGGLAVTSRDADDHGEAWPRLLYSGLWRLIPNTSNCAAAGFVRFRCGCWFPISSRCWRSAPG